MGIFEGGSLGRQMKVRCEGGLGKLKRQVLPPFLHDLECDRLWV